jgi:hypothetical protein
MTQFEIEKFPQKKSIENRSKKIPNDPKRLKIDQKQSKKKKKKKKKKT